MSTQHEAHRQGERAFSRRTVLRGAGVTMGLPWLESLAGFGLSSSASAATSAAAAPTLCRAVHGHGHQSRPLVGERVGRRDGTERIAGAVGTAQGEDQRH